MPAVRFLLTLTVAVAASLGHAQDEPTSDEVKKQKATAVENLSRAGVRKPAAVETPHLLVYSSLPEDKTRAVADAAQKAVEAARKALKYGDKDTFWPGKLTVYALADRKEFNTFARLIESRKVDADETRAVTVRGGEPYAVVTAASGARFPEAALREEAAVAAAAAVLDLKAGVGTGTFTLPTWLHDGFGKMIALRNDPRALDAHRTKVKGLFAKSRLGTFQAADVWADGGKLKDADTYAVSLVEYLVLGADAAKFGKFLTGLKPSDDRQMPDTTSALELADWKPDALDAAWKTWVTRQR